MRPLLFNLYVADIEERLKNRGIRRIRIGRIKIWNLAYSDDLVLLAKNKDGMQDMILSFKGFKKNRKLELNVKKSKMLVFNRRDRDRKEK